MNVLYLIIERKTILNVEPKAFRQKTSSEKKYFHSGKKKKKDSVDQSERSICNS